MELQITTVIERLTHEEIIELHHDYAGAAKTAHLRYVSDSMEGIIRVRKGQGFAYYFKNKPVKDAGALERIKKLVIPPAWTKVWICPLPNGHIQATGYDMRKRKQYRYHALWSVLRKETKFHRLYEFGNVLPQLRQRVVRDLQGKELSQAWVIATVISLMERTCIRVGSEDYERLYGSYGITTLKDNHVKINGSQLHFSFVGKKGKQHAITVKNARLAKLVKQCRDIPGKELFQYYDEKGNRNPVDSGMVNDYIKEATGNDFSTKDIRTWAGSLNLLRSLQVLGDAPTAAACKQNILVALDEVSRKLGNTRAICKKYYVHPVLIELYANNRLSRYVKDVNVGGEASVTQTDLMEDEKVLMRILKSEK